VGTNLTASFLCSREAFRYMMTGSTLGKGQGGRIVLNGSISAHVPRPNSSPCEYSKPSLQRKRMLTCLFTDTSSKHGVSGLTKSLSLDGRKHNIIVSQIDIGNAASVSVRRGVGGDRPLLLT
jgi:NAD(P)-dependent dehydrogenase (short-subunit alcohol dehydrogenase family)